jgi:hypothetical protein
MSDVAPISGPIAPGLDAPVKVDRPLATESTPTRGADQAEFSQAAQLLSRLADLPVRQDLIDRIRGEIDAGTYDTSDKIDSLLDNLAEDILD